LDKQPAAGASVSSEAEELILVDALDRVLGHASKAACHDGDGVLHRAFSLFVFNPAGALLLQQRSAGKRLWPSYWANTCCSHPRRGESLDEAAQRRLWQEMGMHCHLRHVYKFQYHARYGISGSEHELCSVFVGTTDAPVQANRTEVAAWRFIMPEALDAEMAASSDQVTPGLKLEWQRLRGDFRHELPATPA
jgi:isopentenyl-diphosphate delta-isomerase